MLKKATVILALALAAGGCTSLSKQPRDTQTVGREDLKNAKGHVIGSKEVSRDAATGEQITRLSLFIPRYDRGEIVGYEERVRGGSVLLDLHGKKLGGRFEDLRSRKSLTIVVVPREDRAAVAAAPSIDELIRIARLDN
jgi:hypothetical protein